MGIKDSLRSNNTILDAYNLFRKSYRKLKWDYAYDFALHRMFKQYMGYPLDLKDPSSLSEKLQWLKKYWRDPLACKCADKYDVRTYVAEKGLAEILTDSYGVYNSPRDIDYNALPDRFVIKATHGCGTNIICTDKSKLDIEKTNRELECFMKQNVYYSSGEWVYKELEPRFLVEEYLEGDKDRGLVDYKFLCFNGEPLYIFVCYNRVSAHKYDLNFNDMMWNTLPYSLSDHYAKIFIEKPKNFDKMASYAKILSQPFPLARVDLYESNDKVYFGEITFFPRGGYLSFEPGDLDDILGSKLTLPDKYY